MFTGIIQAMGRIQAIESRGGDVRLTIDTGDLQIEDCALGDSIAVNGVCLTAIELSGQRFSADVSRETLRCTTLGEASVGDPVNLEPALQANARLGGHLVSGHVDGLGQVIGKQSEARSIRFQIRAPEALARYIAAKGSICINGISLTVNTVQGCAFDVNIVPHTQQMTTLSVTDVGDQVNLEVDVLARYIERLMTAPEASVAATPILQRLKDSGFIAN